MLAMAKLRNSFETTKHLSKYFASNIKKKSHTEVRLLSLQNYLDAQGGCNLTQDIQAHGIFTRLHP